MAQASNAIQKPDPKKTFTLAETILAKQDSFAKVSTKYLSAERLVKLALVTITKMPDLQRVPQLDVVGALMDCARLGLEPNVEGGRWLLPFKRGKGEEQRFELVAVTDYRGLIDIARRSGEVLAIHADVRKERDLFEHWVDAGGDTMVHLRHHRAEGDRGAMLGVYAIVKLRNGEVQAEYLTLDQVNAFKSRSPSAKSDYSPWSRDFEAMAKKTAIRRLYNLLPKTPEIQAAREVLAEEEADDAIDVTPQAPPAGSRTAAVKEKLAAKTGRPAPTPPADDVPGWNGEEEREPGSDDGAPEPTPPEGQ